MSTCFIYEFWVVLLRLIRASLPVLVLYSCARAGLSSCATFCRVLVRLRSTRLLLLLCACCFTRMLLLQMILQQSCGSPPICSNFTKKSITKAHPHVRYLFEFQMRRHVNMVVANVCMHFIAILCVQTCLCAHVYVCVFAVYVQVCHRCVQICGDM